MPWYAVAFPNGQGAVLPIQHRPDQEQPIDQLIIAITIPSRWREMSAFGKGLSRIWHGFDDASRRAISSSRSC